MSRLITVYSKPSGCPQCVATKRFLDSRGIGYEAISLADVEPVLMAHFRSMGHTEAPVVTVHDGDELLTNWSGFRPDLLANHCTEEP